MKIRSNISGIPVVLMAGLVSAWSAAAQDMDSGAGGNKGSFYASGDAGVAIMQPLIIQGSVNGINPGPRVDVGVGYNITDNFAVELQSGFAHNTLSSTDGQSVPSNFSAEFWTVPVTANGIYTYKFNDHWQAYGGLGAGVAITTLDQTFFGQDVSATDCEFGYTAQAGIKYVFNDRLECGLGYNFLGTLDHHWSANVGGFTSSITTSPTYMHSILLSLTYRF